MQRRAVVLGGAGFLGSHLVDALLADGWAVHVIDSLLTGREENLPADPKLTVEVADITAGVHVRGPVDAICHLASAASPDDQHRFPIQTLKSGALGTHKALGLARATGARLLLTSTSEVYGDPEVHPQPETYWGNVNPVGPRGPYDESKRYAEALCLAYHRVHGIEVRIARIFNTYGPRMRLDDGRVVPAFISAVLQGRPLPVAGDGQQTRSLAYVDDTVAGLLALLSSDEVGPVNIGNPREQSIAELAEAVQEAAGRQVGIRSIPRPADDPQRRCPDITLARRVLGWEPRVELTEGLARTVEWFAAQGLPDTGPELPGEPAPRSSS